MTQPELEEWLAREGATNVKVTVLPAERTTTITFDVGSNGGVLDALDRYLGSSAACGLEFRVACRCTYTGVTMPSGDRWPQRHDPRPRLHEAPLYEWKSARGAARLPLGAGNPDPLRLWYMDGI